MSAEQFPPAIEQPPHIGVMDRMRNKWTTLVATGAAVVAGVVAPAFEEQPAYADTGQVMVGMPFEGKWAYSGPTTAGCGPASNQTSHPSCHENYVGDWAVDLYGAAGTDVKLKASSSEPLTFAWETATGTCGETRRVKVYATGTYIGRIHFTHLNDAASTSTAPTNDMTIGKIANLSCNPGGTGKHAHLEFDNANANTHSCYTNYSNANNTAGMTIGEGSSLGVLGSGNAGEKEECSTPPPPPSTSSRPTAITRGSTNMDVFYRDTEGDLENIGWNASTGWSSPTERVNGDVTGNPDAVARSANDMDVFFVDASGNLKNIGWNSAIGWGGVAVRATGVAGDPEVISRSPTDMDVFYRDTNNNLMNVGWNASNGWSAPLVRSSGDVRGNPTAVARGSGAMDVFYRDASGNLRNVGWNSTYGWGTPATKVNGGVAGDPTAIARSSTDMDVFYRDTSSSLQNIGWNASGGWGLATVRSTGDVVGDPVAVPRGANNMDVFYRGTGDSLRNLGWNATSGWSIATSRTNGGDIGNPVAIARSANDMDVFFKANSGYLDDMGWNANAGWMLTVLPGTNNVA